MRQISIRASRGSWGQYALWAIAIAACFALTLSLAACGTRSPDGLGIPAKYHSDTIVVPDELLAAYQDLQQQPDKYDWAYNEAVWSIPLEYRRANIYRSYESTYHYYLNEERVPTDFFRKIDVYCDPNAEGGGSALAQGAAEATGLAQMLPDRPVSIMFELDAGQSLKLGEIAWLADQVLLYAPDKMYAVVPLLLVAHPGI